MKIKKGDKIIVIAGKDKGKSGKVLHILTKMDKVIVEGVNIIKKHQKAKSQQQKGGIIEKEAPIHISNIKLEMKKTRKQENKKS